MALQVKDRVAETSTTSGTGALTLDAALTGYRRFSSVCSTSDTVYYLIVAVDGNGNPSGDWECGLGTYSSANTLTRTTPQASTNSNNAVNFAAGTKYVYLDATAAYLGTAYRSGGTDVAMADGGTGASLADPNADRILFWDDSAGAMTWLTMGTGLSITGTTLNSSSGTSAVVALTDGATVTVDCSLGSNFRWTIGGNRTFANPTNPTDGQVINVRIIQDGTGNRTWTLGSKFYFSGGDPVLSTAANAKDFISCQYDVTDDTWFCSIIKGMAN